MVLGHPLTRIPLVEFIAITGMHRSGTSLVARIVNLLGADIGPEDELMPPKADNPSGFWEHMPIAQLNDDLLGALGGRWSDPPVPADGWHTTRRFERFRRRAAEILEHGFTGELCMFKDPRASVLLPFWRSVAPIRRTVVCLRDPQAVAASLERRDRMKPSRSAGLYVRYTADAWLDGVDPVVAAFEEVLADPVGEAERLAAALGLDAPRGRLRDQIAGFVDEGLVRARPTDDVVGDEMIEAIEIDTLMRSGDERSIALALGLLRARTRVEAGLREERGRLRRARREVDRITEERDETAATLRLTAIQRDELIEDRDRALAHSETTEQTLRATAEQRDELIEDRDRALALLDEEGRARRVAEETVQTAEEARAVMGARLEGARRSLEVTTARYERLQGAYARTVRGRVGRLIRRWRARRSGR
jgi:hypothetical protein